MGVLRAGFGYTVPHALVGGQPPGHLFPGIPPLPSSESGSGVKRVQCTAELGRESPEAAMRVNG